MQQFGRFNRAMVGAGVLAASLAAGEARAEADGAAHTVSELVLVGAKDTAAGPLGPRQELVERHRHQVGGLGHALGQGHVS